MSSQLDSSALDQENAVVYGICSSDEIRTKLEGKPENSDPDAPGRDGQFRFCPRNPIFITSDQQRRNCATSKDTFCAWGPAKYPYVDNCIACMKALSPTLSSGTRPEWTNTLVQIKETWSFLGVYVMHSAAFIVAIALRYVICDSTVSSALLT